MTYTKVSGLLIDQTNSAIRIEDLSKVNHKPWIPLSLIHGGDALRLERANLQPR